jgi:hypothetical protein
MKQTRHTNPYAPSIKVNGDLRGYGWLHFPEWEFTIAAPPKGGSSSLKRFADNSEVEYNYIPHNQVRGKAYFVVRNPFDRFASLWKSKCRDKRAIADKDVHGMSPRALTAHISSGKKDVHWTPQHELIGNLEVTLIPLEKLNQWWSDNGYGELEVYNATEGEMQMNEMIHTWLCQFYAEDFILYSKACGFS